MVVAQQTYRFTAEEYHRMGEVGILSPDVRVELVDGEMAPAKTAQEVPRVDGALIVPNATYSLATSRWSSKETTSREHRKPT